MVVPSVTKTEINAGTALPLQAGILAPPTTFQECRHFCTASLQYSIFKPLTCCFHQDDMLTFNLILLSLEVDFQALLHRI